MRHEIKHFGTSGEIAALIREVDAWLQTRHDAIEIVAMSESQGGKIGDTDDPFYFSLNIVYRIVETTTTRPDVQMPR
jgi:hypothetical protein